MWVSTITYFYDSKNLKIIQYFFAHIGRLFCTKTTALGIPLYDRNGNFIFHSKLIFKGNTVGS